MIKLSLKNQEAFFGIKENNKLKHTIVLNYYKNK